MSSKRELLRDIREQSSHYKPNKLMKEAIEGVTAVLIVGPVAVGKTTTMHAIERQDHTFSIATNFTTRPRREDEEHDAYEFLVDNKPTLEHIKESLQTGMYVHCKVRPDQFVYGTRRDAYDHKYALLEPFADEADTLRKLPFEDVKVFSLVLPADQYMRRFDARMEGLPHGAVQAALAEAKKSLEWSLDQRNDSIAWVGNNDEAPGATPGNWAGSKIISLIHEPQPAQSRWRQGAFHMLRVIEERRQQTL